MIPRGCHTPCCRYFMLFYRLLTAAICTRTPYICYMTHHDIPHTVHEGRNVKRFREMLRIKQEALAMELGDDWNQKKISQLEQKETIDPAILQQVADVLKMPVAAFQTLDEAQTVNIISNTVNNTENATGNSLYSYQPVFNPLERWLQALEENKRLTELLLQEKDEKIKLLEKWLGEKGPRLGDVADF